MSLRDIASSLEGTEPAPRLDRGRMCREAEGRSAQPLRGPDPHAADGCHTHERMVEALSEDLHNPFKVTSAQAAQNALLASC
jgi:hypothetical protein